MVEAVLFDLGDTLIRFETAEAGKMVDRACRAGYEDLVKLGYHPPALPTYLRAIKRRFVCAVLLSRLTRREAQLVPVLKRCHARMGMVLDDARITDITRRHIVPAMRSRITMDDEAKQVAARLNAEGLKLGLVSNTLLPAFAIDEFLECEGLLGYFPVRVYSSEVRYMKPQRRIFHLALEGVGVPADRVLFVGDRVDKDVFGASRMGMKTVLLLHNGPVPRARVRPDDMIRKLSELPAAVQRFQA